MPKLLAVKVSTLSLTHPVVFVSAKSIQEESSRPEKVFGEFVMEEKDERNENIVYRIPLYFTKYFVKNGQSDINAVKK